MRLKGFWNRSGNQELSDVLGFVELSFNHVVVNMDQFKANMELVHAVEHGHLETVITLLELGAEVVPSDITQALNSKWFPKSKKTKSLIKRYFSQFGYEI